MKKLSDDMIEQAANEWIKLLQIAKQGNNPMKEFADLLIPQLATQNEPSQENFNLFKENLHRLLKDKAPNELGYVELKTEFGPDELLAEAARASRISNLLFPWHMHMNVSVYKDLILVTAGFWNRGAWDKKTTQAYPKL